MTASVVNTRTLLNNVTAQYQHGGVHSTRTYLCNGRTIRVTTSNPNPAPGAVARQPFAARHMPQRIQQGRISVVMDGRAPAIAANLQNVADRVFAACDIVVQVPQPVVVVQQPPVVVVQQPAPARHNANPRQVVRPAPRRGGGNNVVVVNNRGGHADDGRHRAGSRK